ncbi:unnamed protein product [Urochloa humidicola]
MPRGGPNGSKAQESANNLADEIMSKSAVIKSKTVEVMEQGWKLFKVKVKVKVFHIEVELVYGRQDAPRR